MTDQSAVTSLWVSMTSWLTPTTLFLFVNLVIGTIAVTSRFTSNKRPRHQQDQYVAHDSHGRLARAPSLLDRVKSIDFSLYKFHNHGQEQEQAEHFFQQHTEPAGYDTNPVQTHEPQLARRPSFLDRVKSINFSLYNFPTNSQEQEQHFDQGHAEPAYDTKPVEPEQPQLARVPSFLERVKSINLSSVYRSQQTDQETETEVIHNPETETNPEHKPKRSKSETKKGKSRVQEGMKKSVSENSIMVEQEEGEDTEAVERRRPQTTRLERTVTIGDGDHGVDAKADDFINKFKRQLRLQRLDSLLRYKEMLQGR